RRRPAGLVERHHDRPRDGRRRPPDEHEGEPVRPLPALPRRRLALLPRPRHEPRRPGRPRRDERRAEEAAPVTIERRLPTIALFAALAGAAACSRGGENVGDQQSNATTPIDRLIIGQAAGYKPDESLRGQTSVLAASEAARRAAAWAVVGRTLEPVPIDQA